MEPLWIAGVVGGLLALNLLLHVAFALLILPVFARRPPFAVEAAAPDPDAELLELPAADGRRLAGCLYRRAGRPPRGLIIFCHEFGADRFSALRYTQALFEAGFAVLAFDFRNEGSSERIPGYEPLHWLTDYEVQDVLSAIRFVRGQDELRELPLGLFGVSRGGGAALVAAARSRHVECVAVEGVFSIEALMLHYTDRWGGLYVPRWVIELAPRWHVRVTLGVARLLSGLRRRCRYTSLEPSLGRLNSTRVLMIADGEDTWVPPELSEALFHRVNARRKSFWLVEGARHNQARRVEPDRYDERLVEFFSLMSAEPAAEEIARPRSEGETGRVPVLGGSGRGDD